MRKSKVVIADTNTVFAEEMAKAINSQQDMEVVRICSDGDQALRAIRELLPDVLLIDVALPVIDGIGVIEALAGFGRSEIRTLVLSSVNSDAITTKVMSMGVFYYMLKPVDTSIVLSRIRQSLIQELPAGANAPAEHLVTNKELEVAVTRLMREIGIPAHIKGYQFIREAILLSIRNYEIINSITKQLYPAIASQYQTTPSRVERAIRHAIESTWNKGFVKSDDKLFGYTLSTDRGKPTNAEFIAIAADKLRLQYNIAE
ncbi:MAG: sporulation transcription factor Spo0A [Clostridia bacterium]|nr:sporulation transcription factor Spo0A [Clostridia bacterium]